VKTTIDVQPAQSQRGDIAQRDFASLPTGRTGD
jgi:hypothetical protein